MINKSLTDLMLVSNIQLAGLITLWGLTNYLNNINDFDEIILYNKKIGFINFKITGKIFYEMSMFGSFFVLTQNFYHLLK